MGMLASGRGHERNPLVLLEVTACYTGAQDIYVRDLSTCAAFAMYL